jgi:uncharacterized LabA/DUF88 family protein
LTLSCRANILKEPSSLAARVLFVGKPMKTVLLIDGGYLRASAAEANRPYDAKLVETFAHRCVDKAEYLFRVLYYDAPPFEGSKQRPVSGTWQKFKATDTLLEDLEKLERFACRRGSLGFRGWKPRKIPIQPQGSAPLTDADFKPIFEQKGVDMRVGLDIAAFSDRRSADRILLVSGDQDMIPAMKHARKSGLEVGLVQLPAPTQALHDGLVAHSDFVRAVALP